MNRGGRRKHHFWMEGGFETIILDNSKKAALCSLCKKILKNTGEQRLKKHREQCIYYTKVNSEINKNNESTSTVANEKNGFETSSQGNVENAIKQSIDQSPDHQVEENIGTKCLQIRDNTKKSSTTPQLPDGKKNKNMKSRKTLNKYIDSLDEKEISVIHQNILKFFISCNVDFDSITSVYFTELMRSLRPAYVLPPLKDLTTNVLDEVYQNNKLHKFEFNGFGVMLISWQKSTNVLVSMIRDDKTNQILFIDSCHALDSLNQFISKSKSIVDEYGNVEVYAIVSNIS